MPAIPAVGQLVYIYVENNSSTMIDPNSHSIREGGISYSTSAVRDFGSAATLGLTMLYNGTYWFPLSNL